MTAARPADLVTVTVLFCCDDDDATIYSVGRGLAASDGVEPEAIVLSRDGELCFGPLAPDVSVGSKSADSA